MTCRVFLVGECPTDIGDLVELPGYRQGREGFVQPILRRMVAGAVELVLEHECPESFVPFARDLEDAMKRCRRERRTT